MSRIGIKPISVPAGVEVTVADGNVVTVKGPKGSLTKEFHKDMIIKCADGVITVERPSEDKLHKSLHGLTRTLVHNMVEGVTEGFAKKLEIVGVGYRAQKQGKNLVMNLGFSHQVIVPETDTIKIDVPDANHIVISGCDKQEVGQFACEIREKRPPEPYKGKGIRYEGEYVIRRKVRLVRAARSNKRRELLWLKSLTRLRQEQKDIRESATRSTEQLIVLASTYSAPLSIFMHRLSTT